MIVNSIYMRTNELWILTVYRERIRKVISIISTIRLISKVRMKNKVENQNMSKSTVVLIRKVLVHSIVVLKPDCKCHRIEIEV